MVEFDFELNLSEYDKVFVDFSADDLIFRYEDIQHFIKLIKANEIYVDQSSSTSKDLENSLLKGDSIPSTAGVVSKLTPGYYCKFENGFKVGEVDHRGYFKIVKIN